MIKNFIVLILMLSISISSNSQTAKGIYSINTGYTISKVRIAQNQGRNYIVTSSHEGLVMGVDYDGQVLWSNALSGYMNHDLWCEDITGDGKDEILVANADGKLYCLNDNGELLWEFSQNEAPMFSVCVISKDGTPYVVCGSFDLNIYYLSARGELVKLIASSTYSIERTWGENAPPRGIHLPNVIRKIKSTNGEENLLVHGCVNTNSTNGTLYFFKPLADLPYQTADPQNAKPVGDIRVTNFFGDGQEQVLLGSSTIHNTMDLSIYKSNIDQMDYVKLSDVKNQLGGHSYRVIQTEVIPKGNSYEYFTLAGQSIALIPPNQNLDQTEYLNSKYAYNDMWQDKENKRIILASSQSGGSAIHVIDYTNPSWKNDYENLNPIGKIQSILDNTQSLRNKLARFNRPNWERAPKEVFFISDLNANGIATEVSDLVNTIGRDYESPILMGSKFMSEVQDPNDWNRDTMSNAFYRTTRDSRKTYSLTQQEVLDRIVPLYADFPGISTWGGHGNDPYMYSLETKKALMDAANGKKTVLVYPELERDNEDFPWMIQDLMYPLASYAKERNAQIHIRTKHVFWQGSAHRPIWSRMNSGEFADVFVPTMEETGDKSQELSISGRMGFWLSGAVNQWGNRAVPDNASFGRLRQFSSQRLPNHHLRQIIYSLASGATHLNNFIVDREYTSLAWELVAKGALFVPNRDELLSLSPVHVSMTDQPHEDYLAEGSEVKWVVKYDEAHEENNKMVFSRLNGTWMGSPNTEWDFSRYAANEIERRLNYIPAYNNGMVLITPVQNGPLAKEDLPRGKMVDKLHPYYKGIMKEYITDGKNYISSDGRQTFSADTYYQNVKADIEKSAELLPLTVSGDVGWVVAQTDELHLRLTIIDGGYINPSDKEVSVSFNTASPLKMTDILDGKTFDLNNPKSVTVDIPCGLFRFIDIELSQPLINPNTPLVETEIDTIPNTVSVPTIDTIPTTDTIPVMVMDDSNTFDIEGFPWLIDLIDLDNCCANSTVEIYTKGVYQFVYIGESCSSNNYGTLYFQDGTYYCENETSFDCRTVYNLDATNLTQVWNCDGDANPTVDTTTNTPVTIPEEIPPVTETENDTTNTTIAVLEMFPWLNDLVDANNCCDNKTIEVYNSGAFQFIYIEADDTCSDKIGTLYFQDGTFYCASSNNYDCLSAYNLSSDKLAMSWACTSNSLQKKEVRNLTIETTPIDYTNEGLLLYPNPTSRELYLEFTAISKKSVFQIVNILGEVLVQKTIATTIGQKNNINFDVSQLASGTYFVRWMDGQQMERFVKSAK